jgi:hypothetical protein
VIKSKHKLTVNQGLTVVDDEIGDVDGVETSLPNLCYDAALDVRNPPVSFPESSSVLGACLQ